MMMMIPLQEITFPAWRDDTMRPWLGWREQSWKYKCGDAGAGGWWRDGWRTLHSFHIIPSSPLSQISHKVAGLGWVRGAGPLITSQHPWLQPGHSGHQETLCSGQDLRNVSLKPGHWHHSLVRRCHTPTIPSVVPYTVHRVVRRN